jgi:hypothetical protein
MPILSVDNSGWYHLLAFFLLPFIGLFPFLLLWITTRSTSVAARPIRRQVTMVYRTWNIGRWGNCIQLLRRLILVTIATFTQNPEAVYLFLPTCVHITLCSHSLFVF